VLLGELGEEARQPRRHIAEGERLGHVDEMSQPLPELADHRVGYVGVGAIECLEFGARHEGES
jgi:hypothetical protein